MEGELKSAAACLIAVPPKPDVTYPIKVQYCSECGYPEELCEFFPNHEKFKEHAIAANMIASLSVSDGSKSEDQSERKHQSRGGKGMMKSRKKEPLNITISKQVRKGNKSVTVVSGLGTHGIDVDVARKFFAQRFSCGCSKSADDEITIQGDVGGELAAVLPAKWSQITPQYIVHTQSRV